MPSSQILLLSMVLLALPALTQTSAAESTQVKIETTAGEFVVQLDEARAPLTVANFLQYVTDGFYTGTVFHRVVNGFVIQGGGFTPELAQKPPRCIAYIVLHELIHFEHRKHGEGFVAKLDVLMPNWRAIRSELNRLPLASKPWCQVKA